MAKLASVAEAAPLLPEGANGLAANGGLAVPEGATVSLQWQGNNIKLWIHGTMSTHPQSAYFSAGGIIEKVAVITTVGHGNSDEVLHLQYSSWIASVLCRVSLRQETISEETGLSISIFSVKQICILLIMINTNIIPCWPYLPYVTKKSFPLKFTAGSVSP